VLLDDLEELVSEVEELESDDAAPVSEAVLALESLLLDVAALAAS
jgi:hypothetical protein